MAGKRKAPAAKKTAELVEEDGYWWKVEGKEKTNLGRSKRYAEILMQKEQEQQ